MVKAMAAVTAAMYWTLKEDIDFAVNESEYEELLRLSGWQKHGDAAEGAAALDSLLAQLLESLKHLSDADLAIELSSHTFNVLKSFELVAKHQGWVWTYNQVSPAHVMCNVL